MDTMVLDIDGGNARFRCSACGREFPVDASQPFVSQLRQLSSEHRCLLHSPPDTMPDLAPPNSEPAEARTPLEMVRVRSAEPSGEAPVHESAVGRDMDRWVIPLGNRWAVTSHDPDLVSATFELQVEAIICAEQEIADAGGGGDLVILGADGTVRERTLVRGRRNARQYR